MPARVRAVGSPLPEAEQPTLMRHGTATAHPASARRSAWKAEPDRSEEHCPVLAHLLDDRQQFGGTAARRRATAIRAMTAACSIPGVRPLEVFDPSFIPQAFAGRSSAFVCLRITPALTSAAAAMSMIKNLPVAPANTCGKAQNIIAVSPAPSATVSRKQALSASR